jgi:uncharacterized membrane protein YfcA
MTPSQAVLLFAAAVAGGALNSVAGGGSFLSFPALLFTGMPPVQSNATNTVALWPGALASAVGYRKELAGEKHALIVEFVVISLVGGIAGAVLLLHTPQSTFMKMIPWLLLVATLIFTFGGKITRALRARGYELSTPIVLLLQFITAVYGGFFGAGIGILMLAILSLIGMEHIHRMNGLKNILAICINGVAVIAFIWAGVVEWRQAGLMIVGGIIGGYGTAKFVQRLDPRYVRAFVIAVGFAMTAYFFWKTHSIG